MAKFLSSMITSIYTNEFDTVTRVGLNYTILDDTDALYRLRGSVNMDTPPCHLREAIRELVGLAQTQVCLLESLSCSSSSSSSC